MAFKVRMKKGNNVKQVVKGIASTILTLFVGGFLIMQFGIVMQGSCSPFYTGLQLIGWKVGNYSTAEAASTSWSVWDGCGNASSTAKTVLYDSSGVGVLTVVGLVALAAVVMTFVDVSF